MNTVTYTQVQTLVRQIPATKLPLAYRFLADLVAGETNELLPQQAFLRLPLSERRRRMAEQAHALTAHYAEQSANRQGWQSGDFHDDY